MQGSFRLGRIFGLSIEIHYTWFIVFALVALSLTLGLFPQLFPNLPLWYSWVLGIAVTVLFFGSVLAHEVAHSLVARTQGIEISGITLFIFGGVARMTEEPRKPSAEFKMAAAGPAASIALGVFFWALSYLLQLQGASQPVWVASRWLGYINLVLAAFNLVPGFPLDGGRLLRAALWHFTGDLGRATHIASIGGQVFGYLLMAYGFFNLFARPSGWIYGLWWIFIGWFVVEAARSSYQQMLLRRALSGISVRSIMTPEVTTVSPDITLQELVENYFLRLNYAAFPVTTDGEIRGMVELSHVRQVPREQWASTRVADVVEPLKPSQLLKPSDDAWDALSRMAGTGQGRILVTEGGSLVGIVSRTNVMRLLRTKLELGL
jgi:Zn-dependent protease/CBS domain-containing protein